MKRLKKWLGIVWIALAPMAMFWLVKTALSEIEKTPVIDTIIQGVYLY